MYMLMHWKLLPDVLLRGAFESFYSLRFVEYQAPYSDLVGVVQCTFYIQPGKVGLLFAKGCISGSWFIFEICFYFL